MILLDISDLYVQGTKEKEILSNVELRLQEGRVLGLVGPSGSGKSTLARVIAGVWDRRLVRGKVRVAGHTPWEGMDVGLVLQDPRQAFDPLFSIGWHYQEVLGKKEMERAEEVLKHVGFSHPQKILSAYPHELSGGMLQRVSLVLEFLRRPKLLIADEVTASLDPVVGVGVLRLLKRAFAFGIRGMLVISHELDLIRHLTEEVALIYEGRILEYGLGVLEHPRHPVVPMTFEEKPVVTTSKGCEFTSICPNVQEDCKNRRPEYNSVDHRRVRCLHPL